MFCICSHPCKGKKTVFKDCIVRSANASLLPLLPELNCFVSVFQYFSLSTDNSVPVSTQNLLVNFLVYIVIIDRTFSVEIFVDLPFASIILSVTTQRLIK